MKRIACGLILLWCAGLLGAAAARGSLFPMVLIAVALPLSVAFSVFSLFWLIGREARNERGRRLSEYGVQTNDDFLAAAGIDANRLDVVRVIRGGMAKYAKRLSPEQIVSAMPMWTYVAKVNRCDGWDPAEIIMELEDRLDVRLPEAESSLMNISDEETVGDWAKRVVFVLTAR